MARLLSCSLLVLASLCLVHTRPYHEEKHRALLRSGYVYFPGGGYYRLAYKTPVVWAEARRNCQQEGATLAVVNSEKEADNLRSLYLNNGPVKRERDGGWSDSYDTNVLAESTVDPIPTPTPDVPTPTRDVPTPTPDVPTPTPAPANATIHIGFHDIFIEGEYLTVRNEPLIMAGFIRWKVGYPIADDEHNCGGFDTGKFILDNPCDVKLPYVCEIPEVY